MSKEYSAEEMYDSTFDKSPEEFQKMLDAAVKKTMEQREKTRYSQTDKDGNNFAD